MSDYELEPEYGDVSEAVSFDESELPAEDAPEEVWAAWAEQIGEEPAEQEVEPEQEQWINPLEDYPPGSPAALEEGVVGELRRQAWGEMFADEMAGHVREAVSREGIQDEQVVGRITGAILSAREELFRGWLGEGASVGQAIAGLADLDIENGIRVALEGEKYEMFKRGTSLADWQEGRRQQARRDALEGREYRPSVAETSPTLARMRRAAEARAERLAAQQELRRMHGLGGGSVW